MIWNLLLFLTSAKWPLHMIPPQYSSCCQFDRHNPSTMLLRGRIVKMLTFGLGNTPDKLGSFQTKLAVPQEIYSLQPKASNALICLGFQASIFGKWDKHSLRMSIIITWNFTNNWGNDYLFSMLTYVCVVRVTHNSDSLALSVVPLFCTFSPSCVTIFLLRVLLYYTWQTKKKGALPTHNLLAP